MASSSAPSKVILGHFLNYLGYWVYMYLTYNASTKGPGEMLQLVLACPHSKTAPYVNIACFGEMIEYLVCS